MWSCLFDCSRFQQTDRRPVKVTRKQVGTEPFTVRKQSHPLRALPFSWRRSTRVVESSPRSTRPEKSQYVNTKLEMVDSSQSPDIISLTSGVQ
ncbi:hypothetical protein EYF80_009763 [Liparis tanakae]|uniref:Uncharacterized protein n=1 Tax=Liparis tanakae TaxID=230148 RepID=A0A4Z2IQ05_9TELE|nr:hypothetical protein EYF80_009763 [Liparis tanakae]